MYLYFKGQLGPNIYTGKNIQKNKILEQYHGDVGKKAQKCITRHFGKAQSPLRCLISSVGFGMGVDICDVERIIHWGVSKNVVFYWQEVGRAGRDGRLCEAVMFATPVSLSDGKTDASMRTLCQSVQKGSCIRQAVLGSLLCNDSPSNDSLSVECDCMDKMCSCSSCLCCHNCRAICICRK